MKGRMMLKWIILGILVTVCVAAYYTYRDTKATSASPVDANAIDITDVKNDMPPFKREYRAKIDERCSILITMRSWSFGGRMKDGELDQPGGKWVLFDPDNIAEKILDPILVPKIQRYVDQIYAIDKEFIGNKPASFVDETGTVWERKPE